jgi:hypothetical protein
VSTVQRAYSSTVVSPGHVRTTRLTVRPGPALVLSLTTGEYIRVSTPDPDAAVAIIGAAAPKESS